MAVEESEVMIDAQGIAAWEMDMVAPISGTYQGVFKFKTVLSPIQQVEADRDYRELLGKNAEFVSTYIENIAYALAQLKQRVVSAPPFWFDGISKFPGSQVKDLEVVEKVLEAAVAAETKYRKMLNEKHKQSIKKLQRAIEEREAEEAGKDLEQEEAPKPNKGKKRST
jgi:hypothetical protein